MSFEGKTAIVTGSTSGMGVDEAKAFAAAGANVVVVGRNVEAGKRVEREIRETGGEAVFIRTDLTDLAGIENLVSTAIDKYGKVDVLVNNAGVFDKYATLLDTDEKLWDLVFNSDVKSVFRLTKLLLPQMIESGGGTIVNIASIAGLVANKGGAAYTASKHAVIGLTKHIASAYAKEGVRCNAICPGTIVTPLIAEVADTIPKDNIPARRFGKPSEVADLCLFLASDEAGFLNGAYIPIDGGFTIQ